ncbi:MULTISPECIES: hypothetical protein, partial [unclassified Mesorhizobium]|uniref:hypothetical protein n=2 Tax=Mesorhizobium TaxID=68287 RepID=UPI0019CF7FF2
QLRLRFRGPEPGQIDGHPSRISKRRAGICGWRAVFDVGFGERICVFCLAAWLGWLRAPDDRPAAQHGTKQKARTMAGFFEFGCGDRI